MLNVLLDGRVAGSIAYSQREEVVVYIWSLKLSTLSVLLLFLLLSPVNFRQLCLMPCLFEGADKRKLFPFYIVK